MRARRRGGPRARFAFFFSAQRSPDISASAAFCCFFSLVLGACSGTQRDLRAVTALYADARYEAVQAWLTQLRDDYPEMSGEELAQFHYLSGMTAYRLSQGGEALHELALAAHAAREQPSALNSDQLALLYRTLEELSANRTDVRAE